MKIWYGYGSEHSMNLVMIGRFKEETDALKAKQVLDRLTEQVTAEVQAGRLTMGEPIDRYDERLFELLREVEIYILGTSELEQFAYEARVEVKGDQVVVTTEESDVSAYLKVLIDKGARVEVYSAHDYPNTDYGRGR